MSNAAGGVLGAVPRTISTLTDDTSNVVARLRDTLNRVQALNDRLNGGQPRDAAAKNIPEAQPSIRRQVDTMCELMGEIEQEVQAIDARL